jgi:hypothetical protein
VLLLEFRDVDMYADDTTIKADAKSITETKDILQNDCKYRTMGKR